MPDFDRPQKGADTTSIRDSAASGSFASRRAFAQDAVNAAGKKIDALRSDRGLATEPLARAIEQEPVKAVLIAAVAGSVLAAFLIAALRSDDRPHRGSP